MKMLSVEEARTQLSKLLDEAERGEEVVITRNGTPVVELRPVTASPQFTRKPKDVEAFLKGLEKGFPIGAGTWTRDELYEERLKKIR